MARAKRTARAEARRRYRAGADPALADADDSLEDEAPDRPIAPARAAAATGNAPERPSITGAFRSSFRPLDLRGDLRALPRLLLTKAFLAPMVASAAAFLAFSLEPGSTTFVFYNWLSYQFPVAAVFAAGFFAYRASWLLGALIAALSILIQLPFFTALYPVEVIPALLLQGAVFGSLFGAAAAWYRRFLNRANPNRTAGRQATTSRRPDGKIPRKQQQRPMLARRR